MLAKDTFTLKAYIHLCRLILFSSFDFIQSHICFVNGSQPGLALLSLCVNFSSFHGRVNPDMGVGPFNLIFNYFVTCALTLPFVLLVLRMSHSHIPFMLPISFFSYLPKICMSSNLQDGWLGALARHNLCIHKLQPGVKGIESTLERVVMSTQRNLMRRSLLRRVVEPSCSNATHSSVSKNSPMALGVDRVLSFGDANSPTAQTCKHSRHILLSANDVPRDKYVPGIYHQYRTTSWQ